MTAKILCVRIYTEGECVSQHSEDHIQRYFTLDTYTTYHTAPTETIPVSAVSLYYSHEG